MAGKNTKPEFFQLSSNDKLVIKKIEILTQAVERVYPSLHTLMLRSFVHGIFIALGSTVGLSIVLGLITYILAQFNVYPPLNDFFKNLQISR